MKSNEFFGVIGPNDTAEAAFWAPIFQRSNLMTVSSCFYAMTSLRNSVPQIVQHSVSNFVENNLQFWAKVITMSCNSIIIISGNRIQDQVYTWGHPLFLVQLL